MKISQNSSRISQPKNFDLRLFIQEIGKFNFRIYVTRNESGKYMSFNINNNLAFIDSFQFLSSFSDILVKCLGKDNFKYLSQEFDSNVLNLVKKKGIYHYKCVSSFGKFIKQLSCKLKFFILLTSKKISDKEYEHAIKIWNRFEYENNEILLPHRLYLK